MNEELQSVAVDGGNTKNVISCNTNVVVVMVWVIIWTV